MKTTPVQERIVKPASGGLMLLVLFLLIALIVYITVAHPGILRIAGFVMVIPTLILMGGFMVVEPNESRVLILFGTYKGTVKENGFYFTNPFYDKKKISLRARNLNTETLKVNDRLGNPIEIAAVIVWQVEDTFRASFEVDDYHRFVTLQSEAALRHMAGIYAYDNIESDDEHEVTLRAGAEQVNDQLEKELKERLHFAGLGIMEARISHLAYAPEIAGAMLQRQQATAVVAARRQIVEGAVSMVEMALLKLSERDVVHLDDERKAAMVSNLLVVLCSDRAASPVVNAGTLHH